MRAVIAAAGRAVGSGIGWWYLVAAAVWLWRANWRAPAAATLARSLARRHTQSGADTMAKSHGYRSGTRHSFARSFRKRGAHIPLTTYLTKYRVGDYVDVVANGAVHKGMPHKTYHGKTGIVYNVSRRALGVEINKQVRNRIIKKRINVRVEHVNQSKCRTDFLDRVKQNERVRDAAAPARHSSSPPLAAVAASTRRSSASTS